MQVCLQILKSKPLGEENGSAKTIDVEDELQAEKELSAQERLFLYLCYASKQKRKTSSAYFELLCKLLGGFDFLAKSSPGRMLLFQKFLKPVVDAQTKVSKSLLTFNSYL